MVREILTGRDNETLREKSEPVLLFDKELRRLVQDMEDTLWETGNGIGLAAPQIGVNKRVIFITLYKKVPGKKEPDEKLLLMINPTITQFSMETVVMEEGCLSLPDYYAEVERPEKIVVEFFDMRGRKQKIALDEMNAREVQHEIDHLDGILFSDRELKVKEKGKMYI